ncbi:hypothetical protein DL93DRAFT_2069742 [Clavulina sp. PMI_390]|nr:hypothetical protein DL93DRAFT_2069742 [Clavulina sp. PMI_390]
MHMNQVPSASAITITMVVLWIICAHLPRGYHVTKQSEKKKRRRKALRLLQWWRVYRSGLVTGETWNTLQLG